MNLQKLMKQAQQMQERLKQELAEMVVEASVGGGMVTAKMNGHKQLLSIEIEKDVINPEDSGMLQDLVVAAVNEASRRVDEEAQAKVGGMAGSLPGLF